MQPAKRRQLKKEAAEGCDSLKDSGLVVTSAARNADGEFFLCELYFFAEKKKVEEFSLRTLFFAEKKKVEEFSLLAFLFFGKKRNEKEPLRKKESGKC